MLARFDEASSIVSQAGQRVRELTGDDTVYSVFGFIATTAGDYEKAVAHQRRDCDLLEARGERHYLSVHAPLLGRSLCMLGRHAEAEPLAHLGRELSDDQDLFAQTLWRQVQALVHASRGEHVEAEALAREAVAMMERSDALNFQGDALRDLAEVLQAAGRSNEAAATLARALERFERKNNLSMATQVRSRLAELEDREASDAD